MLVRMTFASNLHDQLGHQNFNRASLSDMLVEFERRKIEEVYLLKFADIV